MLYYYNQRGELFLINVENGQLETISSFRIRKGTKEHFSHPVIHNGILYQRHGDVLMAFDISDDAKQASVSQEKPTELSGSRQIRNKKYGQLLRPRNANHKDGTPIVLYSAQPWKCLSWRLEPAADTSYQLINYFTSKTIQPSQSKASSPVIPRPKA